MRNTAERVVANLVGAGLLDPARSREAETVVAGSLRSPGPSAAPGASPAAERPTTRGLLVEIAGYVGGALVMASIALFLAQEWAGFSETVQVATLAAIAVLLAVAGLAVARFGGGYAELRSGGDETRRRLTSALLTAASLAAAFTVGQVVSNQVNDYASSLPVLAGSLTMLLLAPLGYAYAPSALGLLAVAAAGVTAIMNAWIELGDAGESSLLPSLSLIGFAVVWLLLTETDRFREPMVARTAGLTIAIVAAQLALTDSANVAYALTFAVAVAGFAMYLRTAAWPYLAVGVLGVTLVVPEAVIDWTDGALGPAGAVLVAGLTLLAASLGGFRMRKELEQPEADRPAKAVDELV
jgi:hypothetical protein